MRYNILALAKKYVNRARNLLRQRQFRQLDWDCFVSSKSILWGKYGISIAAYAQIQPYAILQCTNFNTFDGNNGSIKIGKQSSIQPFAFLNSGGGWIEIGEKCSVNPYCVLYGSEAGLKIGNFVRIAAHTVIVPSNHDFDRIDIPIMKQHGEAKGIVIGDDVWIGAGVKILDGVEIGKGCVIAAGAVVNKSTEPYGVYAGIPAVRIKDRKEKS